MIDLKDRILYEDADILAVDKPAGLVVHPAPQQAGYGASPDSVSEWFVSVYPESKDVGESLGDIARPGVVHRIDRDTSGVLLLAKTAEGHAVLKSQFQDRSIGKKYHLFTVGLVEDDRGTINKPIARSATNFRKWTTSGKTRGESREAVTYFEVLHRDQEHKLTFVEAVPKTGRTHQIRVHLQSIHHPVLGDRVYGRRVEDTLGFERLALHAREITFQNKAGETVTATAPYPEDFSRALDSIGLSVLD